MGDNYSNTNSYEAIQQQQKKIEEAMEKACGPPVYIGEFNFVGDDVPRFLERIARFENSSEEAGKDIIVR